ncbi:hypothetical protein, variant [Saprolegnia diclina VS20]|uniref:BZIP domain-containing protein n=1 Tax=Saprolegnia diclina (strain VS20) TaxID=1156394 RepID=T0RSV2_SAPDV|nr:hypothetical protein SDRG_09291 [Saprolegnia diclina VS20]XP_008613436.1 hypothetical protein, variant [Saprolegnia diclina VS20]EQC33312.1 hypothetical protein SDRG_09291 [Saprolegnia diclina VS20]EQC33313.1 hypothetical protein, variant [Saprolegnia diclina VS20]|eukprot:XP_008613435.1 hypothetical protein SDRG_09291 [Saprolegnia diclina VS20]
MDLDRVLSVTTDVVELKRLRNQVHQQRYRQKKKRLVGQLERQVVDLRATVDHLHLRWRRLQEEKRALSAPALTSDGSARLVHTYYTLFEHGRGTGAAGLDQIAFLRSVMAPDLDFMDDKVDGLAKLVQQWDVYSWVFPALQLTALHVEAPIITDDQEIVHAHVTLQLQLSPTAIETIYPALPPKEAALVVGRDLLVPISMHFYINAATRQVCALTTHADIAVAAFKLLGDLRASTTVLERSPLRHNAELNVMQL